MIPSNITHEHVIEAINEIIRNGVPYHRESVKWGLLFNGEQFPPKYVISLANKFANDRELDPSQFSGGHETNSFLRGLGFEIVEKSGWSNVRVWLEKVYVRGKKHKEEGDYALGKVMLSPQKDRRGADIYRNMRLTKRGDLVLHLIDNEAIVGISKVAEEYDAAPGFMYLRDWDNQTGRDPGYLVKLEGFIRFRNPLKRSDILNEKFRDELISIRDSEDNVFYTSDMNLRQGAYLTAVPSKLVALFNLVHREKNGRDLPYLGMTENHYTFQLTEDDFEACRRSEKTNYIKPVRRKFEKILKPELIRALGKNFEDFVTGGRHPSPYVASVWTRAGGGHYRDNMWIGFAHRKYEDPHNGIQFQFGINKDSIFSLGIWIEGRGLASSARTEAKERIASKKKTFLDLLRRLGDNYHINAWPPGEAEIVQKANDVKEEDLDTWVELIEYDNYYFQIFKDLSKDKAIEMGTSIVEEIANTLEELRPLYNLFAGIEKEILPHARMHLLYKIAWHPGRYKGGFCGNAQSSACEAFGYVAKRKQSQPCSPDVFHCVDEHEAFADSGWHVNIHPPRYKMLHQLADRKSLVFLASPLDRYKNRYRLVGFYTIRGKTIENDSVVGLEADKNQSSKFILEDPNLEFDNKELIQLFEMQRWAPRSSYEFVSSETAGRVLNQVYEMHQNKEITDPDVSLVAMKNAIESLETMPPAPPITLNDYFLSQRFLFKEPAVSAFYAALKTKGFVILAGLTGTGKTKLPQLFFELVTDQDEQKLFLSVRPDWRDSKPLVGYFNPIEPAYESTKLLDRIKQACANWKSQQIKSPFLVLLDEMNLARVEYYFADFLSVLESGRDENCYTKEPLRLHALKKSCKTREGEEIEPEISLPPNLYFAGTVNLDETTYSFSPKVLDRAFVVEFWEVDLENYPPRSNIEVQDISEQQLKEKILEDLSRGGKFLAYTKEDVESAIESLRSHFENLKVLNKILGDYGLHFGYRVIDEIALFYQNAIESMNKGIIRFESEEQIVDYAVLMKVLPKIHGNRSKIDIPLRMLLVWAIDAENWNEIVKEFEDESRRFKKEYLEKLQKGPMEFLSTVCASRQPKYQKTAEKVARMIYQLYTTGFASFL